MILARTNTVGSGFLVYAHIRGMRTPHIILAFVVCVNASIYPVFCTSLFPRSALLQCLRGAGSQPCLRAGVTCLICRCDIFASLPVQVV